MKYLKKISPNLQNIKEGLYYKEEWMSYKSPIRIELETYINDILLEIKDIGYKTQVSGWTTGDTCVWIANKLSENGISRKPIIMDEIIDVVKHIENYLQSEGFKTENEIITSTTDHKRVLQFYLKFRKI